MRRALRALRYLVSDVTLMERRDAAHFWLARHSDGTGTIDVHPRALGGASIAIREGTTDAQVVWYVLRQRAHLPPAALDLTPRSILDLGANIGVAAAHFAVSFPSARVVAVEPDPENAELCRANLARWPDRCEVIEAAAWTSRAHVALQGEAADARRVEPTVSGTVEALPIDELVERAAVDGVVDYLKMNVEGAEQALLAGAASWAHCVRCLRVEVHPPYRVEDCATDLAGLGFDVMPRPPSRSPDPWVTGIR